MQKRSEDTRQSILLAAISEFAKNGYTATSVSQICATARVSKGAFYHHFPSKQVLFLELFSSWLGQLDEQLTMIRSQTKSVPEALQLMVGLMGNIYDIAGGNLPMFLEFWNQAHHDTEIWEIVIAPYRRYQDYFAAMIQDGIDEGSLKPVDPGTTARVMVALAVGLLLQGLLDPSGANWQHVTNYGFQMLLNDLIE